MNELTVVSGITFIRAAIVYSIIACPPPPHPRPKKHNFLFYQKTKTKTKKTGKYKDIPVSGNFTKLCDCYETRKLHKCL